MSRISHTIEHIIWREKVNTVENINIHAVGFIVSETKTSVTISLTRSCGEYIDREKISKRNIISREKITPSANI